MSVSLTSNFFANARGIIFLDSGGIAWSFNRSTNQLTATGTAGAVLSSVGVTDGSTVPIYTVSGSPLTANGSITLTLNTQTENTVFAGPATGSAAQPGFRSLVSADIPALAYVVSIGSTTLTVAGTATVPTVNLSSTQISNIAAGGTALQSASVTDSITGAGTPGSPLQLSGDAATPGNSYYYGTNSSGTKGWYAATTATTFTGTLTGVTGTVTGAFNYTSNGTTAAVYLTAGVTGTSNSTSMTVTGVPSAIQPANGQLAPCANIENNTTGSQIGWALISGGTITIFLISGTTITSTGFTGSGTKGLQQFWCISYTLK